MPEQASLCVTELPDRGLLRLAGPDAVGLLQGLVTNDVATLTVGQGQRALALSPKGRLVSDMLVIRIADDAFMLGMLEAALGEWLALTKKYVNPRLATVTDESGQWETWMIYGPRAPWAVAQLGGGAHTVEDLANVMVAGLAEEFAPKAEGRRYRLLIGGHPAIRGKATGTVN